MEMTSEQRDGDDERTTGQHSIAQREALQQGDGGEGPPARV